MFMPKCPRCKSPSKSIEADDIENVNGTVGNLLRFENMRHHAHPHLQLAHTLISVGRQIYRRVPGGGLKRCTGCGHEFR